VDAGRLASHQSGLTDAAGYAIRPRWTLQEWSRGAGQGAWLSQPRAASCITATWFRLLAPRTSGWARTASTSSARRPTSWTLCAEGGFAWSRHGARAAPDRLPAFRALRRASSRRSTRGRARTACRARTAPPRLRPPGREPRALSPQGGLRLSLEGALRLAQRLEGQEPRRLWTPMVGPGDYGDGFLESTGPGLLIYDDPAFYPRPLLGHFASAYGILAGACTTRCAAPPLPMS
jgi:hypothetical protein